MTVLAVLGAVRQAMAGIMFLSVALVAKGAYAAWQADEAALLGVGIVALLAIAAAIHWRAGMLHERAMGEELRTAAQGKRRTLEAELKAAGIHVFNIPGDGAGAAAKDGIGEALSDLLAVEDCAQIRTALDGLGQHGKALSMRCAGRPSASLPSRRIGIYPASSKPIVSHVRGVRVPDSPKCDSR